MGIGTLLGVSWKGKKPATEDDGKGALEIISVKAWAMIPKIDDVSLQINCFNKCQLWNKLGTGPRGVDQILPQTMVVNYPKLLPCSIYDQKKCNDGVPCFNPDEFKKSSTLALPRDGRVKPFLDEMKTYFTRGGDPCSFPGRYLRMTALNDNPQKVINETTYKYIAQPVSSFSLEFDPLQTSPLKLCKLLRHNLIKLPNLQRLIIDGHFVATDPWTREDYWVSVCYLNTHPLPYLETLESLSFQGIPCPIQLQHHLLSTHGPQLKKLEIQLSRLSQALLESLKNLTELTVQIDSRADIRVLTHCGAPIKKLRIEANIGTVFLAEYLLQVIHGIPTLYHFDLMLSPKVQLCDDIYSFGDKWVNCSIKCVNISIDVGTGQKVFPFLSFNFLKCFPGLELLRTEYHEISGNLMMIINSAIIHLNQRHPNEQTRKNEIIKLENYLVRGRMYHSNIWQLLPKLKTLNYEWRGYHTVKRSYNRSTYNQLNSPSLVPSATAEVAVARKTKRPIKKKKKSFGVRVGKWLGIACIGIGEALL